MLSLDSCRVFPRLCWLLVALCVGCEDVEQPDSSEATARKLDAGSGTKATRDSEDGEPAESMDDEEPQPSARMPARPAPSDAGRLDAGAVDGGPNEAGATPPTDASSNVRDSSTALVDAALDASPGAGDAATGMHVFSVDSKAEWTASGFKVEAGKCYLVQAKIDDKWLDLDVEADLNGWVDQSNVLLGLFAPFRRIQQDDIGFYQFAACVERDLKACFAIGESTSICPHSSGELFFLVNDVSGFEDNNVGTATVSIGAK